MHRGKGLRILAVTLACCLTAGSAVYTAPVIRAYADTQVSMSQTEKSILVGDTFQLKINGLDDNRAICSWSSTAPSVATVNSRGYVTGMALGSTVINCKVTKSDKTVITLSCLITVRTRVAAENVSIDNAIYEISNAHVMTVGEIYDFDAVISPADSTDKVFWEVMDPSYAIVTNEGELMALRSGITRLVVYAGETENAARSAENKVMDELYIYIKNSSAEADLTLTPTPTLTPAPTLTPEPTLTPMPTSTPVPVVTPTDIPSQISREAKVDSVTLISADTLQIVFGKPVLPSCVIEEDNTLSEYITIAGSSSSAECGTLTAELSTDKTTLTVKADGRFDGTYVVMVASGILTTDGSTIARYVQTMRLKDTTGPEYLGTDMDISGHINTIKFNEEIDISNMSVAAASTECENQTMDFLVDSSNYMLSEDKKSLIIDLGMIAPADENKELMIELSGITDAYGNGTATPVLNITLTTDTKLCTLGQVVSVERVGMYEVHVTFDSPLFDAGYLIIGEEELEGVVSEENACVGIFYLEDDMVSLTGNQVISLTGWYSYYADSAVFSTVSCELDFSIPSAMPDVAGRKLDKPEWLEQDSTNASVVYVKFASRVEEASAVTVFNYVLGNCENPIRAELMEQGEDGATVKLTFSEGAIPFDAEYPFKISGVKAYESSVAMDVYETEITLAENIAPVYESACFDSDSEIVLTFLESSELGGTPDFNVYYNGKNIAWFSYADKNTVRIFLNEDVTKGKVGIMPTDACCITDTFGNVATMSGIYTVVR
ncbi:MAG: Ig-like domain-containing protein [Lachnospiraceae bacterium]